MYNLNDNELQKVVLNLLEEAVSKIECCPKSELDRLVPRKELQKKLGVTEQTITQWKKKGLIKTLSAGRKDYFHIDEVMKMMKGGKL